jgi:hypothetical protein
MVILQLLKTKTKLGCPPRSHVIGREIYTKVASMVEGIYVQAFRNLWTKRELRKS